MKISFLLVFLIVCLAITQAATPAKSRNGTAARKVRKVRKRLSKSKKADKQLGESKSESHPFPIVVTPIEDLHPEAIPIRLELADGNWRDLITKNHFREPNVEVTDHHFHENAALKRNGDYRLDEELHGIQDIHFYPNGGHGDLSAIPGVPGIDYPTYADLPKTHFKCLQHTSTPGFYADVDTRCQVWHYCQPDGRHDRFLCPNGTIFDQIARVCNWWYNVHCEASLSMYDVNFDLYRDPVKIGKPPVSVHDDRLPISKQSPILAHIQDPSGGNHYSHHALSVDEPVVIDKDYHDSAGATPLIYRDERPQTISRNHLTPIHADDDVIRAHHHRFGASHRAPAETSKVARQASEPIRSRHSSGKRTKRKRYKVYRRPTTPTTTTTEEIPTYRERKASPTLGKRIEGVVKRRRPSWI